MAKGLASAVPLLHNSSMDSQDFRETKKGIFGKKKKPHKKLKGRLSEDTEVILDLDDFTNYFDTEDDKLFFIAAAKGKLAEFEKLYNEDPKRLNLVDSKGRSALHHAAKHGHVPIMEFIFLHGGNLNATDEAYDTPLHMAVDASQVTSVDYLLSVGADANSRNKKEMLPLHRAVEQNKPELVAAMAKHKSVDLNATGIKGGTALHHAAFIDAWECAKILLSNGARMCSPCDIGLMPIHVAARNASTKTLNVLLEHAESQGCTNRSELLKLQDNSANTPLHSAVNGGDTKAVRTCMEAGACITDQLDDKSTAVHLACAQGNTEMIQLMHEIQPSAFCECLGMQDVMGMTPLHRAALFDRVECVKFLVEQGADIEMVDSEGRTPVLVAATRKAWCTVRLFLDMNASTLVLDNRNRNILHLIIRNGASNMPFSNFQADIKTLLNQQDEYGCTPLHYASREGQLCTIEQLIKLGAFLNTKNNKRESPLHFAARYGRYNTCRRFLDSPGGSNTINDMDASGKTPLHLAATEGHNKVTQLLLQRGATILRDQQGNTPLHLAAASGYAATMRGILTVHGYLLNAENKKGDTPLFLASKEGHAACITLLLSMGAELKKNKDGLHFFDMAIKHEHKEACIAVVTHDRWKECLSYCSNVYGCPMIGLIRHLPDVCQMVLDRCRQTSGHDSKSKEFHYTYDFDFLQMPMEKVIQLRKQNEDYIPMFALNNMVKFNRVECLSHPVCVAFLQMKWRAYGMWVHMFNLIIYMTFLTALTAFVTSYDLKRDMVVFANVNVSDNNSARCMGGSVTSYFHMTFVQRVTSIIIMIFCVLNVIKEVAQMYQQKIKYFFDLSNLVEWILYLTSGLFIGPFLAGQCYPWQWECGAIAVFLAWFNFLLFLQRFDFYGIYVVMFLEILKTLLQALIVFSILIIAFGLSFYIILRKEETNAYRQPLLSLMTVSVMMTGNIEYIPTWVDPLQDGKLTYSTVAYIMLSIFIVLMPILVMNLLIGLAVGDIEAVLKNARLKRLAMQVELHTDLERKLPAKILQFVDRPLWKVYPNGGQYLCKKLLNKMTATNGVSFNRDETVADEDSSSYIYQELYNQNKRIKTIGGQLEKTYDLLRLVVKKMDITMESHEYDDCETQEFQLPAVKDSASGKKVTWSSPAIRHTLLKQASTLAHWQSMDQN